MGIINQTIIEALKDAANQSATEFINTYVENENEILKGINSNNGIKSEFYCDNWIKAAETSKFLSIYSDFTSIFMLPNKTDEHLMHYYTHEDHRFIKRNISFPAHYLNGHIPKPQDILPAYTTHTDENTRKLLSKLEPFISGGRMLVRPIRSIMLYNYPGTKQDAIIYYASSDTANDDWKIKETNEKDSFTIANGLEHQKAKVLYQLSLPFINNISASTLNEILEDESDLISGFRVKLKELLNSALDGELVDTNLLYNDKIRPELDSINRKFKTINNVHKLGVGATLTALTFSLIAISTDMATNFQSLFNTLSGTSTLGFLANHAKFKADEDKIKDNPYFLLWRIDKANSD